MPNALSQRIGFDVYRAALSEHILLRPLGHTIYWCAPLNSSKEEYSYMAERTLRALDKVKNLIGQNNLLSDASNASLCDTGT